MSARSRASGGVPPRLPYGFENAALPVYFNQDPVINASGGGIPREFAAFFGGGGSAVGQKTTPMANSPNRIASLEPEPPRDPRPQADAAAAFRQMARAFGMSLDEARPRVVQSFPQNPNDMLLSGTLAGGHALSGRAQVVDARVGDGHVVMFAIRPFWRWQTQSTFFLGFNAIRTGTISTPARRPRRRRRSRGRGRDRAMDSQGSGDQGSGIRDQESGIRNQES